MGSPLAPPVEELSALRVFRHTFSRRVAGDGVGRNIVGINGKKADGGAQAHEKHGAGVGRGRGGRGGAS